MTSEPVPDGPHRRGQERTLDAHLASLKVPDADDSLPVPGRAQGVSITQSPWSCLSPSYLFSLHPARMYPKAAKSQDSGATGLGSSPRSEKLFDMGQVT